MALRFRRSVRLFPGVRLNFSRSGVSTTVGRRGATMTFGAHGTHLNLGLPGTGLSYRTRLSPPATRKAATLEPALVRPSPVPPLPTPRLLPAPPVLEHGEREIRSADVSALTSAGLGELKRLINEAAIKRTELVGLVAADEKRLARARGWLRLARTFIVRLFTAKAVRKLAKAVHEAEARLNDSQAELDGCYVQVDFDFDDTTLISYAALTRAFEVLKSCECIWDITSAKSINRVVERTVATTAIRRTAVHFDFAPAKIVRSKYQALQFGNIDGRDLQIFPGFVMVRDTSHDFGLSQEPVAAESISAPKWLWLDWVALVLILLGLVRGGFWYHNPAADLRAAWRTLTASPPVAKSTAEASSSPAAGPLAVAEQAASAAAPEAIDAPSSNFPPASNTVSLPSGPAQVEPEATVGLSSITPANQPALRAAVAHALNSGVITSWQSASGALAGTVIVSQPTISPGQICRTFRFTVTRGSDAWTAPDVVACLAPGARSWMPRPTSAGSVSSDELPPT